MLRYEYLLYNTKCRGSGKQPTLLTTYKEEVGIHDGPLIPNAQVALQHAQPF